MAETALDLNKRTGDYREGIRKGKIDLLDYLIQIATETQGAEVWRALFAQVRRSVERGD